MRYGIIGGGVTGLSVADRLSRDGHAVTLFDKNAELGGIARVMRAEDGDILDSFYHCILSGDSRVVALIKALGLEKELYWVKAKTGFLYHGVLYPFNTPVDILKFSPLSFLQRLNLGRTLYKCERLKDFHTLEGITARDWLIRHGGKETFDKFWGPLLRFKFGPASVRVPATWIWSRVRRHASARGPTKSGEGLGYLRGGFDLLFRTWEEALLGRGVTLYKGTAAGELLSRNGEIIGLVAGGEKFEFERVIVTVPIPVLKHLLPDDKKNALGPVADLDYQGGIFLLLKMNRPLTQYYSIPIVDREENITGLVETSNLIRERSEKGECLVYCIHYTSDPQMLSRSAEDLSTEYIPVLKRLFPGFSDTAVQASYVSRSRYIEPIYSLYFSQQVLPHRLPIPSLYLCNTTQIYPYINCFDSCLRLTDRFCRDIRQ